MADTSTSTLQLCDISLDQVEIHVREDGILLSDRTKGEYRDYRLIPFSDPREFESAARRLKAITFTPSQMDTTSNE